MEYYNSFVYKLKLILKGFTLPLISIKPFAIYLYCFLILEIYLEYKRNHTIWEVVSDVAPNACLVYCLQMGYIGPVKVITINLIMTRLIQCILTIIILPHLFLLLFCTNRKNLFSSSVSFLYLHHPDLHI